MGQLAAAAVRVLPGAGTRAGSLWMCRWAVVNRECVWPCAAATPYPSIYPIPEGGSAATAAFADLPAGKPSLPRVMFRWDT